MTAIVWITGRAATGKSTLLAELEARLRGRRPVQRHCDEDLLFALKAADTEHLHHWHPGEDRERFLLRSSYFFDEGLRIINAALCDLVDFGANAVALVELARGRSGPIDVSYRRALELIEPRIWSHSAVFRLDLPFATQERRNERRAATGRATPPDALADLYGDDDPESLGRAGIPLTTLPAVQDPAVLATAVLEIICSQP
jgi:hypothetical protein